MNGRLIDLLHHNAWASRELLTVCEELSESDLDVLVPGIYGSIIASFRHIIVSESGYYGRVSDDEPPWMNGVDTTPDIAELRRRNDELEARWMRILEQPFGAERTFIVRWRDGIDREVSAGVVLAQRIHHGSDHRSQICTILTTLGVTDPQMGLWDYAETTNRAPQRLAR